MTWQGAFRVFIRVIFIFAYIAFLAASIRHVATFFHNFEADQGDWVNPYTLAVSIDLTALVLTVGVMFFRGNMPWYAQGFTWIFIVALTAFSWFVNWEYAMTFQGNDLTVNDTLRLLNPILASSFAFLNLAYSVVAEFFSSRNKTAAELAAEVEELEKLEEHQLRLAAYKERTKKESWIERTKNTALEARAAVTEVVSGSKTATPDPQSASPVASLPAVQSVPVPSTASVTQPSTLVSPIAFEVEEISSANSDIYSGSQNDLFSGSDSDILSDTGEHEAVEVPVTPRPRITVNLSGTGRNTDKLPKQPKKPTSVTPAMSEKEKAIRKSIVKYPAYNDTQIEGKINAGKKITVSRSYVAKVRTKMQEEPKVLAEQSA